MALLHDLGQALRAWRDQPLFAVTAVAVLAVGIAASTAVFSVVNAVVLQARTVRGAGHAAAAREDAGRPRDERATTWRRPTSRFGARSTTAFEDVAAYTDASVSYANNDVPERVAAKQVSEAYFRVFRAPFAAGRAFAREDDLPGAAPTVVLSHEFWQQRLGGDPAVLGTTISLAGTRAHRPRHRGRRVRSA